MSDASVSSPRNPNEHLVGLASDIPPGKHKIVEIGDREIGVFNVAGTFYALPNMCPHQFGPLCAGPVGGEMRCNEESDWKFRWGRSGEILTCPWHGLEFDLTTGRCLAPKTMRVRQFPTRLVDGEIYVLMGSSRSLGTVATA